MIFYYDIRLRFRINNQSVFKDYTVSFLDITDFLFFHQKKNSSCEIFFIKPHYGGKYGKKIYKI